MPIRKRRRHHDDHLHPNAERLMELLIEWTATGEASGELEAVAALLSRHLRRQYGDRECTDEALCCMDRRYRRTEPDPCSGLCDADVLRASQLQHSVQYVDRDGHLARLSPVRLRTQPLADDALPARDIALHQGAPVIPDARCQPRRPRSAIHRRCASRCVGAISAAWLGTAFARGGTPRAASG